MKILTNKRTSYQYLLLSPGSLSVDTPFACLYIMATITSEEQIDITAGLIAKLIFE